MAAPANAAVRERRRRSTPLDLEHMNVIKALTAAEYSRRQFILNFAASKDTRLLVPGQKSEAVKAAEEWVVAWLGQNGCQEVNSEFFRYKVDERLWSTYVGSAIEFPFGFMSGESGASTSDISSLEAEKIRPKSEAFPHGHGIELNDVVTISMATSAPITSPRKQQQQQQQPQTPAPPLTFRRRSTKTRLPASSPPDKKRSFSLTSLDDLKTPPKSTPSKSPFFVRLGRSWSRRLSAAV
ncbi:hypothetical protein C8A05DRAFT_45997 [Staphylotrichum tortipilum]|uniref:Uncharacterized protein n=1 Tax=Staphylotrichum tortipilum TaxID=2831512 RepID=A0AAN6MHL6_9PEZI|nr:hypothetical protein C8A05DRAFT_45997 [Staphylotrichum longicolle]